LDQHLQPALAKAPQTVQRRSDASIMISIGLRGLMVGGLIWHPTYQAGTIVRSAPEKERSIFRQGTI